MVVNHRGGHTSWYNSKAFELAGVTKDTPDPEHGRFFRDESGEHNGRVAELARDVFAKVGTRETFTPEQQRERGRNGMRYISELLTAAGLTTVHDAGADRDRILAYEDARANGELRHRAAFLVRGADTFAGLQGRRHPLRLRRRVAARRRGEVRRRRLGVRAHDAHEHAVRRHRTTTASSR